MKLNNRFIFGLLSILLAAVIAFVALPTIAKQTNGKTEIVRISKPILKGEQITAGNTEIVEVGSYNLPPNIAHSLADVKGLYATADLSQGDYILTSKTSATPISSDVALNSIPSGKVAISLTVKTLASGLSDKLQPNDIIRVYHFLDVAEEVPELRFVKVLSVTDAKGVNVDNTKDPVEDEEKQQSATITVLASPEQARVITSLENDGVAHVALISRNNDKLAEELLAAQELFLQEIYFPEPEEEETESEFGEQESDGAEKSEDESASTEETKFEGAVEDGKDNPESGKDTEGNKAG
ncbi:Flp pilus assembly protein CpaB [Enterocloster clostridioformis]|uniref:Flp pilus assembly protein CpaB n=1 Tax=Enterocloster clostridioformis TaxID=1531 RepID=A0A2X2UAU3_9FIRM|nr:RcpC/CpaB family pilus assembly protein [Enterocloster clostridioformis]MCA5577255.1 pilus assembly protein CpaB [Enterocloster clostridioformis]SQB10173.1 Flp pilus assembly protein CpaB [Enterocloster clostridioformis]